MKKTLAMIGIATAASSISASAAILVAGWDAFPDVGTSAPTHLAADTAATLSLTSVHNNWSTWNFGNNGASNDGTFGGLSPTVASASTDWEGGSSAGQNLSLNRSDGTLTITLRNNSGVDRVMNGFHFDSITRFNDAADTWAISYGGAISGTGTDAALANVGSMSGATPAQRDIDIDLSGLADNVWEAGSDAIFILSFTGATNASSGGGQELVVDNIGITVVPEPSAALLGGLGTLLFLRRRRR